MKTFLVGGAVRDELMGKIPKDHDFLVVGATEEEMLSKGFKNVGKSFPVFLHPETRDEFALARTEVKTGVGYKGFSCHFGPEVTVEMDLERRDLTLNSLAKNLETGEIIDPFGGREDIKNKILRHTSNAFQEDPVRVLRLARFKATFEFSIAEETKDLVKVIRDRGELSALSGDRINIELNKVFSLSKPWHFFEALVELEVFSTLFPFLSAETVIENMKKVKLQSSDKDLLLATLFLGLSKEAIQKEGRQLRLTVEQMAIALAAMNLKNFLKDFSTENILKAIESSKLFRSEDFSAQQFILLKVQAFSDDLILCLERIGKEFSATDWETVSKKASTTKEIAVVIKEKRMSIIEIITK